jgi:hypothetical protein
VVLHARTQFDLFRFSDASILDRLHFDRVHVDERTDGTDIVRAGGRLMTLHPADFRRLRSNRVLAPEVGS